MCNNDKHREFDSIVESLKMTTNDLKVACDKQDVLYRLLQDLTSALVEKDLEIIEAKRLLRSIYNNDEFCINDINNLLGIMEEDT